MSQGVGHLMIHSGDKGLFTYALTEGATVEQEIIFSLMRPPTPGQFDIREMTPSAIAEYLAKRIEDEDEERRQDALERSFYDE